MWILICTTKWKKNNALHYLKLKHYTFLKSATFTARIMLTLWVITKWIIQWQSAFLVTFMKKLPCRALYNSTMAAEFWTKKATGICNIRIHKLLSTQRFNASSNVEYFSWHLLQSSMCYHFQQNCFNKPRLFLVRQLFLWRFSVNLTTVTSSTIQCFSGIEQQKLLS